MNFLALLGWSYDDKTTIMSGTSWSSGSRSTVSAPSPATFDYQKLDWMNGVYLRALARRLRRPARRTPRGALLGRRLMRGAAPLVQEKIAKLGDFPAYAGSSSTRWKPTAPCWTREPSGRRWRRRSSPWSPSTPPPSSRPSAGMAERAGLETAAGVPADPGRGDRLDGLPRPVREPRGARQGAVARADPGGRGHERRRAVASVRTPVESSRLQVAPVRALGGSSAPSAWARRRSPSRRRSSRATPTSSSASSSTRRSAGPPRRAHATARAERLYRLRKTCEAVRGRGAIRPPGRARERAARGARALRGRGASRCARRRRGWRCWPTTCSGRSSGPSRPTSRRASTTGAWRSCGPGESSRPTSPASPTRSRAPRRRRGSRCVSSEAALEAASEASRPTATRSCRERWFEPLLGPEAHEPPTSYHVAYMRSLSPLAGVYTKERAVEVCLDTLAQPRLPPRRQPNIQLDLEDRPQKSPRACVIASDPPQVVHLITRAQGGLHDYQAFLHEAGHALHYAAATPACRTRSPARSRPRAHRDLLVPVEAITREPAWHAHYFLGDEAGGERRGDASSSRRCSSAATRPSCASSSTSGRGSRTTGHARRLLGAAHRGDRRPLPRGRLPGRHGPRATGRLPARDRSAYRAHLTSREIGDGQGGARRPERSNRGLFREGTSPAIGAGAGRLSDSTRSTRARCSRNSASTRPAAQPVLPCYKSPVARTRRSVRQQRQAGEQAAAGRAPCTEPAAFAPTGLRADPEQQLAHDEWRPLALHRGGVRAMCGRACIIDACDADEHDDRLYLAMRFVEGGDLSGTAEARGPDPARPGAETFGRSRARSMAYAEGLVHRDVKPGNILMGPHGHIYLSDFGVAKATAGRALTDTGSARRQPGLRGAWCSVEWPAPSTAAPISTPWRAYSTSALPSAALRARLDHRADGRHLQLPRPRITEILDFCFASTTW